MKYNYYDGEFRVTLVSGNNWILCRESKSKYGQWDILEENFKSPSDALDAIENYI